MKEATCARHDTARGTNGKGLTTVVMCLSEVRI